ncbi:ATP-dependent RecD-like DNA helicase [Geomonas nitrogeniifigens]|uniref:AAA family ATPase n=1 Tax=Geomonas diazotrophica TaxID=2843197 RepID=UPI001C2CA101|nr:AAA family ATPase [Geomonas nitrogeniifigens]QXE87400.1 ATP-dependent RecD-like DNA helicase [Geomonas nitrogeniifigens]
MKHLSIRLPWHDRGWDGHICDNPRKNTFCKGFNSVNAEKIRCEKNDALEEKHKGKPVDLKMGYIPPCSENINVFGAKPITHVHKPKSFIKNTSPKTVSIEPGCSGTWPFEDMWDESGGRKEADERKEAVEVFFDELKEAGEAGLVFYYCNYDNPISADSKKYLLAGIARIKKVHSFIEWDDIPKDQQEKYGSYIWSRCVENSHEQRIRLPYQEYIRLGKDANRIAVFAEGDLSRSFKYVAHHVTDDNAISLIDKAIAATNRIIADGYLPASEIDSWKNKLLWLKDVRKECWISRGLYPGLGSVLKFLGMARPEEFIRLRLRHHPVSEIKDYLFDRFEGKAEIATNEKLVLEPARCRFQSMLTAADQTEKVKAELCRDRLPLFDLDDDQVKNILGDKRGMYSITTSLSGLYENPYAIAEEYIGGDPNDFINFEKIDHGMVPSEELVGAEPIALDDPRRLRCLMYSMLTEAAEEGHTFLEWGVLAEKVGLWHDQNDKNTMFNFDLATWNQHKAIFAPKLVEDTADGIHSIYLKTLNDAERKIRCDFLELLRATDVGPSKVSWGSLNTKLSEEQNLALERLYTSRLSVLTGTAGTGKTTVISSLVKGIRQKEPRHDFLLLAPTGKASLILRDRIDDSAVTVSTIHSFLMKKGWVNAFNFTLKSSGGSKAQCSTVIVDECSMIDVRLFAALLRAIDMENVERVILVGDYNQLPPIGPGKIFYDLIQYFKKDDARSSKHLVELRYNWRQAQGSKASVLASHYAKVPEIPDENIFAELAMGAYDQGNQANNADLIIEYWKDEVDLENKLPKVLSLAISNLDKNKKNQQLPLGDRYNKVHGLGQNEAKNIEAINIISPYRHNPSGVDNINLIVQTVLRGKDTVDKWNKWGYVFNDKVLQIRNFTYHAYEHATKAKVEYYVPNGTLGYVFPKKNEQLQVKFPKDYDKLSFYLSKKKTNEMLELGYATSVHKAQGSQFDITILVLPAEDSDFLSREMLYTALTRSTKIQIILAQNDLGILKDRLWLGRSDIVKRNSSLFGTSKGLPTNAFEQYKPENLIYQALPELFVRSKGELQISKALSEAGIGFFYEKPLVAQDNKSFKLPDFTFRHRRKEYFWEHNGMLDEFDYAQRVEKKRRWYSVNGYQDNLIETPIEGLSLEKSIEYIFNNVLNLAAP